jgi:DNA replicative helicase MCM subunit Mcm2 (Cdc46/Mcm family)
MASRGPKAQVPLEEILADGAACGLDRDKVLAALAALMEEGDCYMPRKGFYRLV